MHEIITLTYNSSEICLVNTSLLCNNFSDINPVEKYYSTGLISTTLQKSMVFTRVTLEKLYIVLE